MTTSTEVTAIRMPLPTRIRGKAHTNLVLVRVDGEMWTALGRLNGGEVCHKIKARRC